MSVEPSRQDNQEAPATRATFTGQASGPATAVAGGPATAPEASPQPKASPTTGAQAAAPTPPPDGERTRILPRLPAATMDEPLLSDAARLRGRWQQVQASFVDDPQEAVGAAADLIEQTAQALVGALRQRQRQLRTLWERDANPATGGGAGAGTASAPDTEHLRLLMQRYRALFNQLCRP